MSAKRNAKGTLLGGETEQENTTRQDPQSGSSGHAETKHCLKLLPDTTGLQKNLMRFLSLCLWSMCRICLVGNVVVIKVAKYICFRGHFDKWVLCSGQSHLEEIADVLSLPR